MPGALGCKGWDSSPEFGGQGRDIKGMGTSSRPNRSRIGGSVGRLSPRRVSSLENEREGILRMLVCSSLVLLRGERYGHWVMQLVVQYISDLRGGRPRCNSHKDRDGEQ